MRPASARLLEVALGPCRAGPARPGPLMPRAVSDLDFHARSTHRAVPCWRDKSFTRPKRGSWHEFVPF